MYENEDQLLWNPELLPENEVVEFLAEASKRVEEQAGEDTIPEMPQIKDNEEVTESDVILVEGNCPSRCSVSETGL